jgi:carboxyl-terminal processing protease
MPVTASWCAPFLLCSLVAAQGGALFDRVAQTLAERFHDRGFRERELPALVAAHRPAARAAASLAEERAVIHALLAQVPATHLALYSKDTHAALVDELAGKRRLAAGFELEHRGGRFFVRTLLEGGPAVEAGLRRGDRVVAIDGVATGRSGRLDWRADDAWLPDDPELHRILVPDERPLRLTVERAPGERARTVTVAPRPWSARDAANSSIEVLERGGRRFGYVHLHLMHVRGITRILQQAAETFGDVDGLVLDLRGRGGSAAAVTEVTNALGGREPLFGVPVVALIDRGTRSAKEVLAHELRKKQLATLVGERTAGAVIPATFADVGHDSVLMFPSFTLGSYTRLLEGKGVAPDVAVADPLPYAAGADPILAAGLAELQRKAARAARI